MMDPKTEYQFKYIPTARRFLYLMMIIAVIVVVVTFDYHHDLIPQQAETLFNITLAIAIVLGMLCIFRFPLTGTGILEKDCVIINLGKKQKSVPYKSIEKIERNIRAGDWVITITSERDISIMPPAYVFTNSRVRPFMVALAEKVESLTKSKVISNGDRLI